MFTFKENNLFCLSDVEMDEPGAAVMEDVSEDGTVPFSARTFVKVKMRHLHCVHFLCYLEFCSINIFFTVSENG